MNQKRTHGIVLTRINYGEADRIVTFVTPGEGKLALIAKGARRVRSKLAGGIELFSECELTYIPGKKDVGTLISSRLKRHYGDIATNIQRTMLGYDLLKLLHKTTEDTMDEEYYELLRQSLMALDDVSVPVELIRAWFYSRLLALGGHVPNLQTNAAGDKLTSDKRYEFDFESTVMMEREGGAFGASEIKLLRLLFTQETAIPMAKITDIEQVVSVCLPLITNLQQLHLQR